MGLFGKLFDKKECDICGGEIGLLGNRKLEDGNLCKECAKNLSPWFEERRHSTVESIKAQLDYREANKEEVAKFQITRTLGEEMILYIDENQGKFCLSRAKNLKEDNPDVLSFSQVTGCDLDVDMDRDEDKFTNNDGEQESYNPPRYIFRYDYYVIIRVNHPYFDDMKFRLNRSTVNVRSTARRDNGIFGFGGGTTIDAESSESRQYERMGEEIKEALLNARQQVRDEAIAAAQPKQATTCPWCGATTTPDASGCCEYCGGSLND